MRRVLPLFLALCLLLCACAAQRDPAEPDAADDAVGSDLPDDSDSSPEVPEGWELITMGGEQMLWNGYMVQEPACDLDISTMTFADFGKFFAEEYAVSVDTYTLTPGEITEATVYHIAAEQPGKTVYIVAGVHGDERAAWFAGTLLQSATIKSGELYVLAPANANGAKNNTRYVTEQQDLNRSFPGDPEGNEAERFANAVFEDIRAKNPDLVFDLHEAIIYTEGRDFLGSTLIFTDLASMEELFFDMLFATQDGSICTTEFGYTGPGPNGSINSTVTNRLGIPTITVETFRGYHMERRVSDQLDIVQYALTYLGLR